MRRLTLTLALAALILLGAAAQPAVRCLGEASRAACEGAAGMVALSAYWLRDRLGERPRQRLARAVRRSLKRIARPA